MKEIKYYIFSKSLCWSRGEDVLSHFIADCKNNDEDALKLLNSKNQNKRRK